MSRTATPVTSAAARPAKCESHAKACEAATLHIGACGAIAKRDSSQNGGEAQGRSWIVGSTNSSQSVTRNYNALQMTNDQVPMTNEAARSHNIGHWCLML